MSETASEHLLSPDDLYFFREGTHTQLYLRLGAHCYQHAAGAGVSFNVWAPHATYVSVVGPFNSWNPDATPLQRDASSGTWQGVVEGIKAGALYKYFVANHSTGFRAFKSDPFAFAVEPLPGSASVTADLQHDWQDAAWMSSREQSDWRQLPVSIYELHLPSWRRKSGKAPLSYRELAPQLCEYVKEMGFSHVQILPIAGGGLSGSISHFAPAAAQGGPLDLMWLIDYLHREGLGAILSWTATRSNQTDEEGLHLFDSTHLFEVNSEPFSFNLDRPEVRSFLLSSARFWIEKYHFDGLYVPDLQALLYASSGRFLLRNLNGLVLNATRGVQTFAKHYSELSAMSRAVQAGGLGFSSVLDSSWVQQTLHYLFQDPYFRRYHHDALTSRLSYAFHENFILPLSHEEVKGGKGSLLTKLNGNEWQKFATLRLLFGYMWSQPGEKLLFMGSEFGQWSEWDPAGSLDWLLLDEARHAQVRLLVGNLNHLYRSEQALHELDSSSEGFAWVDPNDSERNVISYLRLDSSGNAVLVVCNFSPVPRHNYRLGVPKSGMWDEILNTDAVIFGGSGVGNFGAVETVPVGLHGYYHSLTITVPPMAAVYYKWSAPGV